MMAWVVMEGMSEMLVCVRLMYSRLSYFPFMFTLIVSMFL